MGQIEKKLITWAFLCLMLSACDSFEKELNIALPEVERQLVVECYLRPNQPFRVLVTETKGYFDDLNECPMVKGALVIMEYGEHRDTLSEAPYLGECTLMNPNFIPFLDNERTRFYNYGSQTICPLDYDTEFKLYVYDSLGQRSAYASTKIKPIIPIDSVAIRSIARTDSLALHIVATDNIHEENYYRLQVHRNSIFDRNASGMGVFNVLKGSIYSSLIADNALNGNSTMVFNTDYVLKRGNRAIISFYHLSKAHYDYIRSMRESQNANGNPFAQPPSLVTNIQGGLGIFTAISLYRDTIRIQ